MRGLTKDQPHLMAAHARLKYEFTEDEKCHYLMKCLIFIQMSYFDWSSCQLKG